MDLNPAFGVDTNNSLIIREAFEKIQKEFNEKFVPKAYNEFYISNAISLMRRDGHNIEFYTIYINVKINGNFRTLYIYKKELKNQEEELLSEIHYDKKHDFFLEDYLCELCAHIIFNLNE